MQIPCVPSQNFDQSLKSSDVFNSSFQNINSSVSHIYQKWPNTQISWLGGSKMKLRVVFKILQKQSDKEKQIYFGSCLCLVSLWDLESSGWTGTTDLKRLKAIEWRTVRYRSHRLVISVFVICCDFFQTHRYKKKNHKPLCFAIVFVFGWIPCTGWPQLSVRIIEFTVCNLMPTPMQNWSK